MQHGPIENMIRRSLMTVMNKQVKTVLSYCGSQLKFNNRLCYITLRPVTVKDRFYFGISCAIYKLLPGDEVAYLDTQYCAIL